MSKFKKALKKAGKAAAAGAALYGMSKMGKKPGMDYFSKKVMSKMGRIADAGGVSKLKSGSKTTVMAKGCKLGRKRRTIIT